MKEMEFQEKAETGIGRKILIFFGLLFLSIGVFLMALTCSFRLIMSDGNKPGEKAAATGNSTVVESGNVSSQEDELIQSERTDILNELEKDNGVTYRPSFEESIPTGGASSGSAPTSPSTATEPPDSSDIDDEETSAPSATKPPSGTESEPSAPSATKPPSGSESGTPAKPDAPDSAEKPQAGGNPGTGSNPTTNNGLTE